ncbi:MAG: hypothetical protein ACU833_07965 [Gammaproteobacteria bacterium]
MRQFLVVSVLVFILAGSAWGRSIYTLKSPPVTTSSSSKMTCIAVNRDGKYSHFAKADIVDFLGVIVSTGAKTEIPPNAAFEIKYETATLSNARCVFTVYSKKVKGYVALEDRELDYTILLLEAE